MKVIFIVGNFFKIFTLCSASLFFIGNRNNRLLIDIVLDKLDISYKFSGKERMKPISEKTMSKFMVIGFICAFLLCLLVDLFSQTNAFQNSFKPLATADYSTAISDFNEYNLETYYSEINSRVPKNQECKNHLDYLSFRVPFSNSISNYFNSISFIYNFHFYFNSQLHNIPPPTIES